MTEPGWVTGPSDSYPRSQPGAYDSMTVLAEGPFMMGDGRPLSTSVKVPRERLQNGPVGARLGLQRCTTDSHPMVSMDGASSDWRFGAGQPAQDIDTLVADRQFLSQHAYAIASATLALFETTLGRRMPWRSGHRLMMMLDEPIAFEETGYERASGQIHFGRHRDRRSRRPVPLALYHDIVAHEVTHAVLDGYRPRWADEEATADQFALHEAIADLVAMLSVFGGAERVEQQLQHVPRAADGERLSWDQRILASGLFGFADGLYSRGAARRPLAQVVEADWRDDPEPHHRGEAVVAAVLATVTTLWSARLAEPGGHSSRHQVAAAGAKVGKQVLAMVVRGIGFMPPVDATWEDLLRGIIAADITMVPQDVRGYRDALLGAFSTIGVTLDPSQDLFGMSGLTHLSYPVRLSSLASDPEEVNRFIWENPALIEAAGLHPDEPVTVDRVRSSTRVSPDGFVVSEIGASFVQVVPLTKGQARQQLRIHAPGQIIVRGGGVLRFDEGGRLCFTALKRVMDPQRQQSKLAVQAADTASYDDKLTRTFHRHAPTPAHPAPTVL